MKVSCSILSALTALLCAASCANNKEVTGSWFCTINDGQICGTDTITFAGDSSFTDSRTLLYVSTESGFDIRASFSVSIAGRWSVRGDSIYVCHAPGTFRFTYYTPSFSVTANRPGADTTALAAVRTEMSDRLAGHLQSTYEDRYEAIAGRPVCIGRISGIGADSLVIENAGVTLSLMRLR